MFARGWIAWVVLVTGTWLVACNPTENGSPDPADSDEDGAGDSGPTRPESCPDFSWIIQIDGTVVDETGAAIPGAHAGLCLRRAATDQLVCVRPVDTDADGHFVVVVPEDVRCMRHAAMRISLPDSGRVTVYCELALPTDSYYLTVAEPVALLPAAAATSLPPLGDEALVRTVGFAEGLELDVRPADSFAVSVGYDELAASSWAPDRAGLCFVEDPEDLTRVYGFVPEGNVTGGGFPLRIPNSEGLAANSTVALYVLGGLDCVLADSTIVDEGQWISFGQATVSADGQTIAGDPLPCLGWIGYGPP